jgi:hypothetical protein
MIYKTPLAFAVVSAVSAGVMTLLGGMAVISVYWVLIHFAVVTAVSFFKVWTLLLAVVTVFIVSIPVELVYARRKLFGRTEQPNLKPVILLFPSLMATYVCHQIFDWLNGRKKTETRS